MLTVPKREGDYRGDRVPLSVKEVAGWLNVKDHCVRCIERPREGYPLTRERAVILTDQTGVSPDWLLGGKPKSKPFTWDLKPYTQANFDACQIELAKRPRQASQAEVSFVFARNLAVLAAILLLASKQGKFQIYKAHLQVVLGETLRRLGGETGPLVTSLVEAAFNGYLKNFDTFRDVYEKQLKKIYPRAI